MTVPRIAALGLGLAGGLALVGSLSWWWLSYADVYRYDYLSLGQAGRCLLGESEICRLATTLCRGRHTGLAAPYSSATLWIGLGLLCASLVIPGRGLRPLEAARRPRVSAPAHGPDASRP